MLQVSRLLFQGDLRFLKLDLSRYLADVPGSMHLIYNRRSHGPAAVLLEWIIYTRARLVDTHG